MNLLKKIDHLYRREAGYKEILKLAFPLILSTGSVSVQQFVDRMFLTWYSPEAIAASLPSGLLLWTVTSLFIGIAAYVNTFVAQYFGAKEFDKIGAAVWQGIYISILVTLFAIFVYPNSELIFKWVGHRAEVQALEVIYFKILLLGSPFIIISNAITGFFTGRGKTVLVLWINVIATIVNIVLDYIFIFGKWGIPEMGIAGAGYATLIAMILSAILFFIYMIRPKNNQIFKTVANWRFDYPLFKQLIKFGFPNGIQFLLELFAFTIFIMLVGKIGILELAATNIAFNINSLAFMPMFGLSIAVSTLVGQRIGEKNINMAVRCSWGALHISLFYFGILGLLYFLFPELFLAPFAWKADAKEFLPIAAMAKNLLKFVAIYCLFDAVNMTLSGAIKGAGDTKFVAIASVFLAWILMLLPSWLAVFKFNLDIYWLWTFVTIYVAGLGITFLSRFMQGKWKSMSVING